MTHDANPYDAVPYPSYAFARSNPDELAMIARLFGLTPPDPRTARVLELGCAAGGNLLPVAARHPDCEVVGVDLGARQIATAREDARALGLRNARFEVRDLADGLSDLGDFDYIVCHGVFSWVPRGVQEAIFRIVGSQLRAHGVAFISYNTHPGWQLHGAVRDVMMVAAEGEAEPLRRVAAGRSLLAFLARAVPPDQAAYHRVLNQLDDALQGHTDAYVLHEFLEEVNDPTPFEDFIHRAAAHGLNYLGEAGLTPMLDQYYAPQTHARLRELCRDIVELEQTLDFLRGRTFRQTLLVQGGARLQRDLTRVSLDGLFATSRAKVEPAEEGGTRVQREHVDVILGDPLTAELLTRLAASWPETLDVTALLDTLVADAVTAHAVDPDEARRALTTSLLTATTLGLAELHVVPPPTVRDPGERPCVWAYTRFRATRSNRTTSPRHESLDADGLDLRLLGLLDGTRTRADVLAELRTVTDAHLAATGEPHPDAARLSPDWLDGELARLRDMGLFVPPETP